MLSCIHVKLENVERDVKGHVKYSEVGSENSSVTLFRDEKMEKRKGKAFHMSLDGPFLIICIVKRCCERSRRISKKILLLYS